MSNWKTGWCVGSDIERIADSNVVEMPSSTWHPDDAGETANHLSTIFRFLSRKDCDIIYLYYLCGKKQTDICVLLDRTQPAVSYDLKRAKKHVSFVTFLLSWIDRLVTFLCDHAEELEPNQIKVMLLLFFSTSFTKTARVMGVHQITCRYIFNGAMARLKEIGHPEIVAVFDTVLENLNAIKKTEFSFISSPCVGTKPTSEADVAKIDMLDQFQWHSAIGISAETKGRRMVASILTADARRMACFNRVGNDLLVHKATHAFWKFSEDGQSIVPIFDEDILTEDDLK
jgi:hypothetical protein